MEGKRCIDVYRGICKGKEYMDGKGYRGITRRVKCLQVGIYSLVIIFFHFF